ncbi:MAG TPA: heavy metal sensor histidine kinase [Steroidobacteraceae bacterium]|jgi:two-component system heavy metal sensor histidine kinase CusS|nr:heavy metal sensor histidine kinase [Steroidobacteraceae bacterium]
MRLSLSARLALIFSLISIMSLSLVGVILFDALSDQVYVQDDLGIVLATRHLRRLAAELDTTEGVREHQERLVSLVLGDPALAMRIEAADGTALIDYNPPHIHMIALPATEATQRVVTAQIHRWTDGGATPVRGVASMAALRDGSSVKISVARSMSDRASLLENYRNVIWATVTSTAVVAVVLCYLLVRRALAPLRAISASAQVITAERLDSRIDVKGTPLELDDLTQALNAMLQRLQLGFDRLWHFTADLAHDLRTPIANMRGASEVALTRTRSASEYQALLASNIEECDRVSRMIENVLFLARAESPQFALHRSEFDAGEELQRIAEYFEGVSAEKAVQVQVSGQARLSAERELFRRAVSNLLANALRYTPSGQTITLTAAQTDQGVSIQVRNPGEGIAPPDLAKVFDRFYRGDKARSNSGTSTGLGLAIVKTIVEIHGGTALARSEVGGVTTFELLFPVG